MIPVSNRIIQLFAFWHLLQSSFVIAPPTKAPATPYSLPEFSADLSTVGRVVNGMALGMGISNGQADDDHIVSELLNLGPGVTMNSLVDKNVIGLETDLGKIPEAVEKACGTTGECVKKTVVDAGSQALTNIDLIAFQEIDKILNSGGMLNKTVKLKKDYSELSENLGMEKLIKNVKAVKSILKNDTQIVQTLFSDLDTNTRYLMETEAHFQTVSDSAKQVDQSKVLAEIAKLLALQPHADTSSDFNSKLKAMKDELSVAEQKFASLLAVFSKDSIDNMSERMDVLKDVVAPKGFDGKMMTGGFFNGFADLDSLLKDAESPIVKKMFPEEHTVEQIKSVLDPVINFTKRTQSVKTKWQSMKFPDGVVQHIDSIRNVLQTAQKEVTNGLSAYKPLYGCTKDMETSTAYDLSKLTMMTTELAQLTAGITALSAIFKTHKPVYPLLKDFKKQIDSKQIDKLEGWGKLKDLESKLDAFQKGLKSDKGRMLEKTLDSVDDSLFDGKLKTWVDGLGVSKSLNCLKQNQGLTTATAAAPIQSLVSLTSKNTDLVSVQSAATVLKAPLVDWKQMQPSAKSTKTKREVKNGLDYNQLIKATKEFSDGIAVIRASAAAFSASDNINKLLAADAAIAVEVGKVTDKSLRAEIDKVWNKASKDVLKMLPDAAKKVAQLVKQKPNNLTDFGTFFKEAQTVPIGDVDCEALSRVFGSFKNPADLGSTLKSLEHVRFSKATDKLKFASGSTSSITNLLNSIWTTVPKQKQGATATSPLVSNATDKEETTPIWIYVVIAIAVLGFIGGLAAVYFFCVRKKNEKNSAEDLEGGNDSSLSSDGEDLETDGKKGKKGKNKKKKNKKKKNKKKKNKNKPKKPAQSPKKNDSVPTDPTPQVPKQAPKQTAPTTNPDILPPVEANLDEVKSEGSLKQGMIVDPSASTANKEKAQKKKGKRGKKGEDNAAGAAKGKSIMQKLVEAVKKPSKETDKYTKEAVRDKNQSELLAASNNRLFREAHFPACLPKDTDFSRPSDAPTPAYENAPDFSLGAGTLHLFHKSFDERPPNDEEKPPADTNTALDASTKQLTKEASTAMLHTVPSTVSAKAATRSEGGGEVQQELSDSAPEEPSNSNLSEDGGEVQLVPADSAPEELNDSNPSGNAGEVQLGHADSAPEEPSNSNPSDNAEEVQLGHAGSAPEEPSNSNPSEDGGEVQLGHAGSAPEETSNTDLPGNAGEAQLVPINSAHGNSGHINGAKEKHPRKKRKPKSESSKARKLRQVKRRKAAKKQAEKEAKRKAKEEEAKRKEAVKEARKKEEERFKQLMRNYKNRAKTHPEYIYQKDNDRLVALLMKMNENVPWSLFHGESFSAPFLSKPRSTAGVDDVELGNPKAPFLKLITAADKRPELEDKKHPGVVAKDENGNTPDIYTDGKYDPIKIVNHMTTYRYVNEVVYRSVENPNGPMYWIPVDLLCLIIKDAWFAMKKERACVYVNGKHRVYGDLHGEFLDLVRSLMTDEKGVIWDDKRKRFLVQNTIFMGDYVDRGDRSLDVVVLLCLLKIIYGPSIILIRGNHEFKNINAAYGFLRECREVLGHEDGFTAWVEINEMFSEMPVAVIKNNNMWISHGGVSKHMLKGRSFLKMLKKNPETKQERELHYDVIWSDPQYSYLLRDGHLQPEFKYNKQRKGHAYYFNPEAVDRILKANNFLKIIRGHQVKKYGISFFHNFKVITVFSATNQPGKEGESANWGAYLIIDGYRITFHQYRNKNTEAVDAAYDPEPLTEQI